MFVIPDAFARDMITVHGLAGRAWIEHLPLRNSLTSGFPSNSYSHTHSKSW
ncbi:MAG TPA: hypothetical protein VFA10_09945 [Ktedonobacteraceae bacterium]|jgi:hypothetical protein|nr:hypothetical protein [Ktedonobacteraceae bacterium]